MTAGKPTARSVAWKVKSRSKDISDVIPPLSIEVHPSERAFETLDVYIASAIRMASHDRHLVGIAKSVTMDGRLSCLVRRGTARNRGIEEAECPAPIGTRQLHLREPRFAILIYKPNWRLPIFNCKFIRSNFRLLVLGFESGKYRRMLILTRSGRLSLR